MRGDAHGGCGGRAGETHREQSRQGAPAPPNDPDAAPPARRRAARAAAGSCAAGVADRAWLALLAWTLPIERLAAMRLIVTPGTILRWRRDIVRRRQARLSRRGRSGRPATERKVRSVVLRLARENESWGTGGSTASWPDWV